MSRWCGKSSWGWNPAGRGAQRKESGPGPRPAQGFRSRQRQGRRRAAAAAASLAGVANSWKQRGAEAGRQAGCWWASRRGAVLLPTPNRGTSPVPRRSQASQTASGAGPYLGSRAGSARPLLAHLGSRRHAAAGSRVGGNPVGETSGRDVTLGDVTRPPGSAGVPTEEASPAPRGARAAARESPGVPASLAEPGVCPAGRSRPRVR